MRVTNYRQDGSDFMNVLTLHPVHDSDNEYRYSIGILSDGANAAAEAKALEKLRNALPTRFDSATARDRCARRRPKSRKTDKPSSAL